MRQRKYSMVEVIAKTKKGNDLSSVVFCNNSLICTDGMCRKFWISRNCLVGAYRAPTGGLH